MVRALAIDVGTTSIRTAIVDEQGSVSHIQQQKLTVTSPQPGEVELDANEIKRLVLELSAKTLSEGGACDVVGITNQRATTIVFDAATGEPVGPALGWQDLRTVIDCLILQGENIRLAPNQSATKAKWLVEHSGRPSKELRFATIETWIAYVISNGALHITDTSNAAVNGFISLDIASWDQHVLDVLKIDNAAMPTIVDTMGSHGNASALGNIPITALVGDQSASLFGQSCITKGTKITFGTGAMLNMIDGSGGPETLNRFTSGCFPIVARSQDGKLTWGIEGIVLSAGSCLEWIKNELGLVDDFNELEPLATSVPSSDGVSFVPALAGLGTPYWDFGARGGFFGLTRGTTKAHMVRAVLEGIAQRGADLVIASEEQAGVKHEEIRVDGGITANEFFLQSFSNFTGLRVSVSTEREATTRGAGLMALVGAGHLSLDQVEKLWSPAKEFTPQIDDEERATLRKNWMSVVARTEKTIPELSSVQF